MLDTLPVLAWTALPDGHVDFLNRRWCDYTGVGVEDGAGSGWQVAVHPEDLPGLAERWRSMLSSGEPAQMEARVRRSDGEYRRFLIRGSPSRGAEGQIVRWYVVGTDVEGRRQAAEALNAGEKRLLEMVARGAALSAVLDALCRLVEEIVAGCRSSVVLVDPSGAQLERGAAPSIPDSFIAAINGRPIHVDSGPSAMAMCLNEQVVAADLTSETRWAASGWCRMALAHGLRACLATPIVSTSGKVLGALAIYYDEPGTPTAAERALVEQFTHLASIAVARTRAEEALHESIDEREWAETRLAGEKRLLEMVASGRSLPDILGALCRFVEEATADCYCGVYPIDWSGPTFQCGVAPSLPSSYTEPIEGLPVRRDIAPCGIAAFEKTQVIAADIESDSRWRATPYRDHVLAHGLRSVWSTPICSLEGRVLGTFCVYQRGPATPSLRHQELITQVTHIASIAIERAEAEAALRRSEALLAEGQRLSSTGTFSWRIATDEITWSDQTYRILDVDPGATPTFELIDTRLHPEDAPAFKDHVERARREGDNFEVEYRLLLPDHSVRYLHVVAHATRDRSGQLEYIGAVQDVTERRFSEDTLGKLRSELAHVARVSSLGALTASIAHEVNQPLAGIITNANTCLRMLAADPPNVDGARETARRTIRDGNRASEVITRLRALFGKRSATTEPVDLNEAAREVIALSVSELQRRQVAVRPELADGLQPVAGDRVQLQQVILNLLLNASDAMTGVDDRPRQIVIRTERDEGDHVRLSVRDTGTGFEPRDADRLFEPFYTTKTGGMGIGLSVSRSIVESHRGRLWATSNDGPGATFSFSIPFWSERVAASPDLEAVRTEAVANAKHG